MKKLILLVICIFVIMLGCLDTFANNIALDFQVTDSIFHPEEPVVYITDSTAKSLYFVNYSTGEMAVTEFVYSPESLTYANGELYVSLLISGHQYYTEEEQLGAVSIIDPDTFEIKDQFIVDIDPFDIEADDDSIYLISGSNQWSAIKSYSRETKQKISVSGIRHQSYGKLHPFMNKLYTIDSDSSPRDMKVYGILEGAFTDNSYESLYHGDYDMATNFRISPDGKYIFNGAGTIFYCDSSGFKDMRYKYALDSSFSDIAFDLQNNVFYTSTPENKIAAYDYDTMQRIGTYETSDNVVSLNYREDILTAICKTDNNEYYINVISTLEDELTPAQQESIAGCLMLQGAISGVVYDPERGFAYAIDKALEKLYVINIADWYVDRTVNLPYIPSNLCISENGQNLYIVNYDDNFLVTEIDLATFSITRNLSGTIPDDYNQPEVVHKHIYERANRIYIIDGEWVPALHVFDLDSFAMINTSAISGIGDMAFTSGNGSLFRWKQGGRSAGLASTDVSKYSIIGNSFTLVDQSTIGYPDIERDPLDTPIFILENKGTVLCKNFEFDINDLDIVLHQFPEPIYAVDNTGTYAAGKESIYEYDGQAWELLGSISPEGNIISLFFAGDNLMSLSKTNSGKYFVEQLWGNTIIFVDTGLEAAVRDAIGKTNGEDIFESDVRAIESLDATDSNISNITGIENLTNLQYLNLSNNLMVDIGPLSNLTKLKELHLSSNRVKNVEAIYGLTELTKLYLDDNQIEGLDLRRLVSLEVLNLNQNDILEIDGLQGLVNLIRLSIGGNDLDNLDVISDMTELVYLDISRIDYNDIGVIGNLTNLQYLYAEDNYILDISPLSALIHLKELDLSDNAFNNLNSISNLLELETLDLSYNVNMINKNVLGNLTKLKSLNLTVCGINDLSPLVNCTDLASLWLYGNNISNIQPLSNITKLEALYLDDNPVNDISPLISLTNLHTLSFGDNQIDNIGVIVNLTNLVDLFLLPNPIQDFSPAKNIYNQLVNKDFTLNTVDSIEISGQSTITIPLDGSIASTYSAIIVDPNDVVLSYEPVTWSITNPMQGVGIDSITGVVTIDQTANPGTFTIQAINGAVSDTFLVTLESSHLPGGGGIPGNITFADPGLEAVVREIIGKTNGEDILESDVSGITELVAENKNIADLSGIENLVNLTSLNMNNNKITDINPFENLTGLSELNISFNKITSLDALSGLTGLKRLFAYSNQISDLNPISELVNMELLSLSMNQITDLDPLAKLNKLISLDLSENNLDDIDILVNMPDLLELILYSTQINDLSVLTNLTKLQTLNLSANNIIDLSSLANLTDLHSLYLTNNNISNINALGNLTKLSNVDLSGNTLGDITVIQNFTMLRQLFLNICDLSDIAPLSNCHEITSLHLGSNNIADIQPLSYLINLEDLNLTDNEIEDLEPISNLTKITHLSLRINQISDISPIRNLVNLTELHLLPNPIYDFSPAKSFYTNLVIKDFTLNTVASIDITGLTSITIPANGNVTSNYTAVVKDPNNVILTCETVKWSLVNQINGVVLNSSTGVVTVDSSAESGTFTIKAENGFVSRTLKITMNNLIYNSSITPATADFDKNTSEQADITVIMTLNGNTLSSIKNGSSTLVSGTDYSVAGNSIVIKKSYLSTLLLGTAKLTFIFNAGENAELTITVTDSTASGGGFGGGNGGGGGGGGGAGKEVPVDGVITMAPTFDYNTAKTLVSQEVFDDILDSAPEENGAKNVTININDAGVDTYNIQIPATELASVENDVNITINTAVASVTLPSNMFDGVDLQGAVNIGINVSAVNKAALPASVAEIIGDAPVIEINAIANGIVKEWNNTAAPVTISIPYMLGGGKSGDHVTVFYIDGSGKLVNMQGVYNPETKMVTFATTHFSRYVAKDNTIMFTDLEGFEEYSGYIQSMAAKGIIEGIGNNKFAPGKVLTRAEYSVLLVRMLQLDMKDRNTIFTDVKLTDWYAPYVNAANKAGLIQGIGANIFAPNETISLQDGALILVRALKYMGVTVTSGSLSGIADFMDISGYAQDAVSFTVQKSITLLDSEGRFNAKSTVDRASAARLIYNVFNYKEDGTVLAGIVPELLPNGSFTANSDNWNLYTEGEAIATGERDTSVYDSIPVGYKINCTTSGTSFNQVQLYTHGINIKADKKYILSFRAASIGGDSVPEIILMKADSPWTQYAPSQEVTIGSNWNTYSIEFTASASDINARITFFLGDRMPDGSTLYIDSISFKESSGAN